VLTASALHRLEDEGRTQEVPLSPGVKAGTKGVRLEVLRAAVFALGLREAEKPDETALQLERDRWLSTRRKGFQRAIDDLTKATKLRHEGGWVWFL
jgi:hypothetical protein